MSSYVGRHAELYDTFYADKPYGGEAAFVDQCLRRQADDNPKRLLELACGTGRHALELERLGYEVVALDYSADMIDCARRRSQAASSKVEFHEADMRSFDLTDGPFDAAICLFDSIGYVGTNEAVTKVLQNVHRHLREDGLFVFEFWHAAAMLRGYDPLRVRRWKTPDGDLVRISETTLDCARQVCNVHYTIHGLRDGGAHWTISETQTNRFFLVQEMAMLLTVSGFVPLKWYAGFEPNENITEDIWHIVAVARKCCQRGSVRHEAA